MFESKKVGDGVVAEFNDITGEIELISDGGTIEEDWSQYTGARRDEFTAIYVPNGKICLREASTWKPCDDGFSFFGGCTNLRSIDCQKFDTSKIADMTGMFERCSKLETLDVSTWDTSNVFTMKRMFYGCEKLAFLDVNGFDTSRVTSMEWMFACCHALNLPRILRFDTSNVLTMEGMFNDCVSLTSLDLNSFDTSKVTNMSLMFAGCTNLKTLDINKFNANRMISISGMFLNCHHLKSIDVNYGTSIKWMCDIFKNCYSLQNIVMPLVTGQNVDTDNMFDGCRKDVCIISSDHERR